MLLVSSVHFSFNAFKVFWYFNIRRQTGMAAIAASKLSQVLDSPTNWMQCRFVAHATPFPSHHAIMPWAMLCVPRTLMTTRSAIKCECRVGGSTLIYGWREMEEMEKMLEWRTNEKNEGKLSRQVESAGSGGADQDRKSCGKGIMKKGEARMVETIKVVSCLELLRRATCSDVRLAMEIKKKWRHKFPLLIYVETRYKTLETCSNSHAKICRRRNSFHVCELCSSYRGYPMWSRRATHRCDRRRVLREIVSGWKWRLNKGTFFHGKARESRGLKSKIQIFIWSTREAARTVNECEK